MKSTIPGGMAVAALTLLSAGATAQTFPASIVGTWTMRANNTDPLTVSVASQSSDTPCAAIAGTMGGSNDTIAGFYCPGSGSVSFLRNAFQTGATYQVFTGQLSWAAKKNFMTGNFANFAGSGDTGEYGFTAYSKP